MSNNKLTGNPFKKNSKAWIFCELADIDYETGFSNFVPLEVLDNHGLKTINGGDWCRSDGSLGRYFNINRKKERGRIVGVELLGYKKNHFSNKINKKIKSFYAQKDCKVLAVTGSYIECDHKDGRKDNFELPENQKLTDFQSLHKSANIAKRQHCKECKESGIRFDAKRLGYSVSQWIGPENYTGTCIGCFWYDPQKFNEEISHSYVKER
jgi:hypothetical protein